MVLGNYWIIDFIFIGGTIINGNRIDPIKNEKNIRERGLSFKLVLDMDESTSFVLQDRRKDYGEPRFRVFGLLDGKLHVFVFTPRKNNIMRIISFRKCNEREEKWYEEKTA